MPNTDLKTKPKTNPNPNTNPKLTLTLPYSVVLCFFRAQSSDLQSSPGFFQPCAILAVPVLTVPILTGNLVPLPERPKQFLVTPQTDTRNLLSPVSSELMHW